MRRLLACGVALGVAMCVPALAAHGGGGHGMRTAHNEPSLKSAFHSARHEAEKAFGNEQIYLEKLILNPNHVEFQIVVDPFFYYPYAYPYYAPYPGYGYEYPPPPPPEEPGYEAGQEPQYGAQSEAPPEESQPTPEDAERASYGLVQLRGVPDGASVDLDGRFWMKAERLENRWVALPRGPHTITVHVEGREPAEQQVDVEPGKTRVVRFTLGRHRA